MASNGVLMPAPIVVTHEGGAEFAAQIRGHRLILDQPEGKGGNDAGPMPVELLGAALGSCVALYAQRYCETRSLPYQGLRVEVQQEGAKNPSRVGVFQVTVRLARELPEPHMERLLRAAASCPVHHTLEHGAEVRFALEVEPPGA